MILDIVAILSFVLAAGPALLYARNMRFFRPPPQELEAERPQVSVLIPARNEEASIADAVEAVLASQNVEIEVIVLDDHSEDRTAAIVREMATKDSRVRLELAPPLPQGWNGKQHACQVLAGLASFPIITFLDADVRVRPEALARMNRFREVSGAALVSGFPRQETGTWLERLVIPLIHFLLLGYLSFDAMRRSTLRGFGAGCGQWFLTTAESYAKAGGHAAIRSSRHDGVKLPRAYRTAGLKTDLCDVTDLARCRMYHSALQVWLGFAKNAREGLAAPQLIVFTSLLLFVGQVLPLGLVIAMPGNPWAIAAILAAYAPRLDAAWRFRQSWIGAILHPLGVFTLLAIQWYATVRELCGRRVGWKGRV